MTLRTEIKMVQLKHLSRNPELIEEFGPETVRRVKHFHESFPEYEPTPLASLDTLAKMCGVRDILVKDESFRFGLNAFKVLGSSYAIARVIAKELGMDEDSLDYTAITGEAVREKLGERTFITATDGNHGRGAAWTANRLRQKSVVYMPKGSAKERLDNIKALGADASITELSYDDVVQKAAADAKENGWTLVQDTSWEGYEEIPAWIMQGYTTMAYEAAQQIQAQGKKKPTHIFLQAGVGSMCAAVTAFFAALYKEDPPVFIIVEPDHADCLYRTAEADDGRIHEYTQEMKTIMAGLACGRPCAAAWDILHDYADYFVSIPDWVAAQGMRVLANPEGHDPRVVSGESGAAAFGLAAELLLDEEYADLRKKLGLDENSTVLCFSTEGATDRENYRKIVRDGAYAKK